MAKKTKSKTSHIKRGNQKRTKLLKQGKLKTRRNKKFQKVKPPPPPPKKQVEPEGSDSDQDVTDMVEDDDLEFIKKSIRNNSYGLATQIGQELNNGIKSRRKRKLNAEEKQSLEENYAETQEVDSKKKTKYLLPIKTAQGLVERIREIEDDEDQAEEVADEVVEDKDESDSEAEPEEIKQPLTTAELFATRDELLQKKKFNIGILSTGLIENPEVKLKNFEKLLELMEEKSPEIFITVRKLACVSLLEVFKDLLPAYQIKIHDEEGVRLKKHVKQLHDYESSLLKAYKGYLLKLEKMISILKRKRGETRIFPEPELKLAEVGLECLCHLLTNNYYFNYSKNIVHLLIPFLDCGRESARTMVSKAVKTVFKSDKRGDASLEIVRKINFVVKNRSGVHCEVLQVFLSLNLKDVNLNEEQEQDQKEKKLNAKKHKLLQMSKKEKKRTKRLKELEQELLETKAEESKKTKYHHLTEITKTVFMIYFRILKRSPNSKLLSVTLEGLAKFAHCINVEFYHDLVNVLDNIIADNQLGYKEHNHCVQTVFTILSGQGDVLNIDPLRFYTHLYRNILQVHAGRNHADLPIILKTLDLVLLKRRKKISLQRLLAFTKRLSTLSLQLQHNGALACLAIIKTVLMANKATDVLLDTDATCGQGTYNAELEEPEYCNPSASALWELTLLQRHYHPSVRQFASKIAAGQSSAEEGTMNLEVAKKTPYQLFVDFDPSAVVFRPSIQVPKNKEIKDRNVGKARIKNQDFEKYIKSIIGYESLENLNTHAVKNRLSENK